MKQHRWDRHHLEIVARQDYVNETGEAYIAQECEQYGVNERGGLDKEGKPHCYGYIDNRR